MQHIPLVSLIGNTDNLPVYQESLTVFLLNANHWYVFAFR